MPLLSTWAAASSRAFAALRALFADTFGRTTSGSLGTSSSGTLWTALRGIWYANGSQAQSDDPATSYPVATIAFNADATLSLLTTSGVGVVFWQTGAGDWWASVPIEYSQSESYTCNTCAANSCCTGSPTACVSNACCTGSNTCVSNSCCTGSPTDGGGTYCVPRDVSSYSSCGPCGDCYTITAGTGCQNVTYNTCNTCVANACCTGSNTCVSNSCCSTTNTCVSNSCCTGSPTATCSRTRYYWAVRILQAVANTVSTILSIDMANSLTDANPIAGIHAATSGATVTVRAYSDTGMSSQVGTDVTYTATPAPSGTGVGIIKAPSTLNQGSTADSFTAQ